MSVELTALVTTAALAGRVFGALLFGLAVASKLRNFDEFVAILARYSLVPLAAAKGIAALIVGLEIAAIGLLILPATGWAGALLAIALLICFAAAMSLALARGETQLDCGCMSLALRQRVRWALVLRNLVVAAVLTPLLTQPALPRDGLAILDGIAGGAVLLTLYLATGAILALGDSFADLKRRYG
jgi:hypothetical protein